MCSCVSVILLILLSCQTSGCLSVGSHRQIKLDVELLPNLPVKTGGAAGGFVDGGIVIVGGSDWSADKTTKIFRDDVYCLTSDCWEKLEPLNFPLGYCAYASDGSALYLAGGGDGKSKFKTVLCIIDGGKKRESLPDMPKALALCSGALCAGKFYVFGGMDDEGASARLYRLDIRQPQNGWRELATLPGPGRFFAGFTAFGDKLYVLGGSGKRPDGTNGGLSDCWCYEPAEDTWIRLPDLPEAVFGSAVVSTSEGILVMAGSDGEIHGRISLLDLKDMSFRQIGNLPFKTYTATLVVENPRSLVVLGGEPDGNRNRLNAVARIEI